MTIDKTIADLKDEFNEMLDTAASVKGKQFVRFAKIAHASQAVMLLMDQATRMNNVDEEHWARMMDCSATVLASVISDAKAGMEITDEQASEALQYAHTLSEKMQLRLKE